MRRTDAAVKLLLDFADRPLGASSITLAEVFVGAARTGRLGSAQTALHALILARFPRATTLLAVLPCYASRPS